MTSFHRIVHSKTNNFFRNHGILCRGSFHYNYIGKVKYYSMNNIFYKNRNVNHLSEMIEYYMY